MSIPLRNTMKTDTRNVCLDLLICFRLASPASGLSALRCVVEATWRFRAHIPCSGQQVGQIKLIPLGFVYLTSTFTVSSNVWRNPFDRCLSGPSLCQALPKAAGRPRWVKQPAPSGSATAKQTRKGTLISTEVMDTGRWELPPASSIPESGEDLSEGAFQEDWGSAFCCALADLSRRWGTEVSFPCLCSPRPLP